MRVIIAEDTLLVRTGLERLLNELGHEVVGAAGHADDVPALLDDVKADVAILDIRLPPTFTDEGFRLADAVRRDHPGTRVLLLSQYLEPAYAAGLLGDGCAGYLLKDSILEPSVLDDALHRLAGGESVVDHRLVRDLIDRPRVNNPLAALTPAELEVLELMAEGLSDHGIAARRFVSLATVGTHTRNVFRKLAIPADVTDNRRVTAVLAYLRHQREPGN